MSRKQPGRASQAFERLSHATNTAPVVGGEATTPPPRQTNTSDPIRRFTVRFYDHGDTDALDSWLTQARKLLGAKVDASRLVRELLRELAADPALSARIHARLRAEETPTQN